MAIGFQLLHRPGNYTQARRACSQEAADRHGHQSSRSCIGRTCDGGENAENAVRQKEPVRPSCTCPHSCSRCQSCICPQLSPAVLSLQPLLSGGAPATLVSLLRVALIHSVQLPWQHVHLDLVLARRGRSPTRANVLQMASCSHDTRLVALHLCSATLCFLLLAHALPFIPFQQWLPCCRPRLVRHVSIGGCWSSPQGLANSVVGLQDCRPAPARPDSGDQAR